MKVLVTGAKGQLGHDVTALLGERGVPCLGADAGEFDITDARGTGSFLRDFAPDAVVHCAAFTNVDGAEKDPETAYRVNVTGTENVARAAAELGAKIVYISTDYVFDGTGEAPWRTDSPVSPVNRYGETKLGGETAVRAATDCHFIVRTSWVFGLHGKNFVKTMLRLGAEKERLAVVERGETRMKRFLPLGITADERVCSGAHYARFFRDMKHFLEHPELLEVPPEQVLFDEGNEYHLPKPTPAEGQP